jgi:hypothetical protein
MEYSGEKLHDRISANKAMTIALLRHDNPQSAAGYSQENLLSARRVA